MKPARLYSFSVHHSEVVENSHFPEMSGLEIYEVIRVTDGVPLFLEDHLERFFSSALQKGVGLPLTGEQISRRLKQLMDANGVYAGNIRFSFISGATGGFLASFIPHKYPDAEMVQIGVRCGLLPAERQDPNAKVVQAGLRAAADQLIAEKGFYEVLLVDRQGQVTEGSRSNVFFLNQDVFITPPVVAVLPGITRLKVLQLLQQLGERVEERPVSVVELAGMEAVFLTGTSPKVLPVRSVDGFTYATGHPRMSRLVAAYDKLVDSYIRERL